MSNAKTLGDLDTSFGQIESGEAFSVWRSTIRLLMRGQPVEVADIASSSGLETTLLSIRQPRSCPWPKPTRSGSSSRRLDLARRHAVADLRTLHTTASVVVRQRPW